MTFTTPRRCFPGKSSVRTTSRELRTPSSHDDSLDFAAAPDCDAHSGHLGGDGAACDDNWSRSKAVNVALCFWQISSCCRWIDPYCFELGDLIKSAPRICVHFRWNLNGSKHSAPSFDSFRFLFHHFRFRPKLLSSPRSARFSSSSHLSHAARQLANLIVSVGGKKRVRNWAWTNFNLLTALFARIFFMQPSSHVLIVCFATSSSMMYSSSSLASNSSSWSDFLMSTERYDNMLWKH